MCLFGRGVREGKGNWKIDWRKGWVDGEYQFKPLKID